MVLISTLFLMVFNNEIDVMNNGNLFGMRRKPFFDEYIFFSFQKCYQ